MVGIRTRKVARAVRVSCGAATSRSRLRLGT